MKKLFLLSILFLLPCLLLQAHCHHHSDLTGLYDVAGFNPYTNLPYTGTVDIQRQDSVYGALWVFTDGSTRAGTGLVEDGVLSFVFENSTTPGTPGVIVYDRSGHRQLSGEWVLFGNALVGTETLTRPIDHHSSSGSRSGCGSHH